MRQKTKSCCFYSTTLLECLRKSSELVYYFAVFRPSNGVWYLQHSTKGFRAEQFGLSGDVPIPNVFGR